MARLSTGQSYGDTSRRTSQRLLGGAEVIATPGVLAEQTINMPQLQPAAAPVNTFQQSGAPTLGGPVRMFAPPDLPRPNQDMANLAEALGSFNPVLRNIGAAYVDYEKGQEEKAKQRGEAIAAEASRYGTFKSFTDLSKSVEKQAAAGDPAAANYLARLQSLDPRTLPYAVSNIQDSAIKFNLATVKSKLDQMRELPDGTPIQSLSPDDPRYQQLVSDLVMPGDMAISPTVFAANKSAIYAMYGSAGADQAKRHAGWKTQTAKSSFSRSRQSNLALLESGLINEDDFALSLSTGLDLLWGTSGLTTEEYQKTKENFLTDLANEAVAAAGGSIDTLSRLGGALLNAIPKVQAGPNGELLLDQIGGMPALRDFYRKLMTGVADDRELETKFDTYKGEDQADNDVAAALTPEVVANPALFRQTTEALRQRATQLFPGDPDAQMAYTARIDKAIANREKAWITPVQDENAARWYSKFALDPTSGGPEDIAAITSAFRNKELSEADYKSLVMTAGARNREDSRANFQVLRGLQSDLKSRLEAQFQRGDSEGGAVLTPNESRQLWQAMGNLYRQGSEMIQRGPGQDLTGPLTQMYGDAVTKGLTGPQQRQPQPQGQRTPMPLDKTLEQLGRIQEGKGMDAATKETIRKSGMKPSDYYKWQLRQNGINQLTPAAEQELRKLDQMSSISSSGTGGMGMLPVNRYGDAGRRLAAQFSDALVRGIFNAPAAAGTMDLAAAGPVVATGGMGGLLGLIRSGEGGWTSVNRGVAGDSSPIRNLTSLPIGVVEDMQKRGQVFAVGAYQFTPGVLARARKEAGLSPNALMTPENQNKMGMALILGSKRPALAKYIRGQSNDLNAAHLDIASEWAALQGPNGRGVYDGDKGGNMASIPAARVRAALQEARRAYLSGAAPQSYSRSSAEPNEELGSQFIAQLGAEGGYEDTAGPAVQRKPWAGEAGQFAAKGSFQNGLDAINKAGASVMGFLQGKPNDIELVTRFYSKNPEVANQYDLPVNLFVRYISGIGAKGLKVSQAQGQKVLKQIEASKQNLPAMVAWTEQNMRPDHAASYKRNIAKGMIPVSGASRRDAEIDNSLGRFWAVPQKDGSYLITEDFNFSYAPKGQGGDDKRAAAMRQAIPSLNPVAQAQRLVTSGYGKPFKYTLRISPDGSVQVSTR